MHKKTIRVNCTDFYTEELKFQNYIFQLLAKYYDVEISQDPELLLYSCYGRRYRKYNCVRVFYPGEYIRPDFSECDYAFTFEDAGQPRNYRLPDYVGYEDLRELVRPKDIDAIVREKTKFCEFTYSNPVPQERIQFLRALSRYKRVDSFGKVLNNMRDAPGSGQNDPVTMWQYRKEFLAPYKFAIAFENQLHPGCTSEKIVYPMLMNAIPIYWGNPQVSKDFNTRSFINCHEYDSFEAVVERVIEVDGDDRLYRQYLSEPHYDGNRLPFDVSEEGILGQLQMIIGNIQHGPVAGRPRAVKSRAICELIRGWARGVNRLWRLSRHLYYRHKYIR